MTMSCTRLFFFFNVFSSPQQPYEVIRNSLLPHFTDKETEAQGSNLPKVTCLLKVRACI